MVVGDEEKLRSLALIGQLASGKRKDYIGTILCSCHSDYCIQDYSLLAIGQPFPCSHLCSTGESSRDRLRAWQCPAGPPVSHSRGQLSLYP